MLFARPLTDELPPYISAASPGFPTRSNFEQNLDVPIGTYFYFNSPSQFISNTPTLAHMFLHQELRLANLSSSQVTWSCFFQKICFSVRTLTSFLPLLPFPVRSVAASHIFPLTKTICAPHGSVHQITLTKI